MRAGILQHPVAIGRNNALVGLAPFDPRLFERVEPVVEMLAVGPHSFRGLGAAAQFGVLHEPDEGRLDDRHVGVEQNREAGGDIVLSRAGSNDRYHRLPR